MAGWNSLDETDQQSHNDRQYRIRDLYFVGQHDQ